MSFQQENSDFNENDFMNQSDMQSQSQISEQDFEPQHQLQQQQQQQNIEQQKLQSPHREQVEISASITQKTQTQQQLQDNDLGESAFMDAEDNSQDQSEQISEQNTYSLVEEANQLKNYQSPQYVNVQVVQQQQEQQDNQSEKQSQKSRNSKKSIQDQQDLTGFQMSFQQDMNLQQNNIQMQKQDNINQSVKSPQSIKSKKSLRSSQIQSEISRKSSKQSQNSQKFNEKDQLIQKLLRDQEKLRDELLQTQQKVDQISMYSSGQNQNQNQNQNQVQIDQDNEQNQLGSSYTIKKRQNQTDDNRFSFSDNGFFSQNKKEFSKNNSETNQNFANTASNSEVFYKNEQIQPKQNQNQNYKQQQQQKQSAQQQQYRQNFQKQQQQKELEEIEKFKQFYDKGRNNEKFLEDKLEKKHKDKQYKKIKEQEQILQKIRQEKQDIHDSFRKIKQTSQNNSHSRSRSPILKYDSAEKGDYNPQEYQTFSQKQHLKNNTHLPVDNLEDQKYLIYSQKLKSHEQNTLRNTIINYSTPDKSLQQNKVNTINISELVNNNSNNNTQRHMRSSSSKQMSSSRTGSMYQMDDQNLKYQFYRAKVEEVEMVNGIQQKKLISLESENVRLLEELKYVKDKNHEFQKEISKIREELLESQEQLRHDHLVEKAEKLLKVYQEKQEENNRLRKVNSSINEDLVAKDLELGKLRADYITHRNILDDLCNDLKSSEYDNLQIDLNALQSEYKRKHKLICALKEVMRQSQKLSNMNIDDLSERQLFRWFQGVFEEYLDLKMWKQNDDFMIKSMIKQLEISDKEQIIPVFTEKMFEYHSMDRIINKLKKFLHINQKYSLHELEKLIEVEMARKWF